MNSIITAAYPLLSDLVADADTAARLDAVIAACSGQSDPMRKLYDETHVGYESARGPRDLLIYHLCCEPVASDDCAVARNIEDDLQQLRQTLSVEQMRSAYRDKLLNNDQFIDVVYEIAVASIASRYFDAGTLSLETPLAGSARNPDVTGNRDGQKHCIETTVLHETIPSDRAHTRSVMDIHERDDLPSNPPGAMTMDDILRKDPNHRGVPVSKKLRDTLRTKTRQCEAGAVNIVVFGIVLPMFGRDLEDSLYGAPYVLDETDASGVSCSHRLLRTNSGPFVAPLQCEDVQQFIDPFRIVSGVWMFRLSASKPESRLLLNANADTPLDHVHVPMLEQLGMDRARRG